jgi:hypothetical protein
MPPWILSNWLYSEFDKIQGGIGYIEHVIHDSVDNMTRFPILQALSIARTGLSRCASLSIGFFLGYNTPQLIFAQFREAPALPLLNTLSLFYGGNFEHNSDLEGLEGLDGDDWDLEDILNAEKDREILLRIQHLTLISVRFNCDNPVFHNLLTLSIDYWKLGISTCDIDLVLGQSPHLEVLVLENVKDAATNTVVTHSRRMMERLRTLNITVVGPILTRYLLSNLDIPALTFLRVDQYALSDPIIGPFISDLLAQASNPQLSHERELTSRSGCAQY